MIGVTLDTLKVYQAQISGGTVILKRCRWHVTSIKGTFRKENEIRTCPKENALIFEDKEKAFAFVNTVYRFMRDGVDENNIRKYDFSRKSDAIKMALEMYL